MKAFLLLSALVSMSLTVGAQATNSADDSAQYHVNLKEIKVTARFKNDTDRYRYNQMKFYVTTILPYLDAATKTFKEIDAKVNEPGVSRRERKDFVNAKEDQMRSQFEDKVKSLNVTQGVLLVKLISRQTNMNLYKILQEFKNPLTAVKWQVWGRVNGMNLDRKYHPEEERDLENIMDELGYPLPGGYAFAGFSE
ncbi:MAG: DUF4294 domain-containing protein [Bacteroidota bacterium]